MTPEQAARLREPFPPEMIGKLPKGGVQLDFVGHGAVTDRLLEVDPEWAWAPLAKDERGLPLLDDDGNLWITLTVAGVTRLGVGDGDGMKVLIGDAIRNAAMRFGVALDLWIRGHDEDAVAPRNRPQRTAKPEPEPVEWAEADQIREIRVLLEQATPEVKTQAGEWPNILGVALLTPDRKIGCRKTEAQAVIDRLTELAMPERVADVPTGGLL